MVKVVQIVPTIGMESSGPSYSVPALCRSLQSVGCEASLHFCGNVPICSFGYPITCYAMSFLPHRRLGRSPDMEKGLITACKNVDIVHNNSFWMYPNVYGYRAIQKLKEYRKNGKSVKVPKLVNAPRGTLAPWALAHHRLPKKLFGFLAGQYAAMRATDMWHATCEKEYQEIRALGFRQPVAIIPIGIDIPEILDGNLELGMAGKKKMVFFGRLHPVKAVDRLLEAWYSLTSSYPQLVQDWEFLIAGPDGGLRSKLEAMVSTQRIPRVAFIGELNGPAKYQFLAKADLCVLPSFTENFGITVAEALACGTPVIVSTGTPWRAVIENRCGWWVENTVSALATALLEGFELAEPYGEMRESLSLRQMGENGRHWMERDFSWGSVGRKMKSAYEWLLAPEVVARPDWVVVD